MFHLFNLFDLKFFWNNSEISGEAWSQLYTPDFGNCYSYNLPKNLQLLRVLEIRVEVNQAVTIYANLLGHFLGPDTYSRVIVRPHQDVTVDVSNTVSFYKRSYSSNYKKQQIA